MTTLTSSENNNAATDERSKQTGTYVLVVLGCLLLGGILGIFRFILPKFLDIFRELRVELPLPTILVLMLSRPLAIIAMTAVFLPALIYSAMAKSWRPALITVIVLASIALFSVAAIALPLQKIQAALEKK